jgi:hypothetical protein
MMNYSSVVASLLYLSGSGKRSPSLASTIVVVTEGAVPTTLGVELVTGGAIVDFEYILRTGAQSVTIAMFYSCRTGLRWLVCYE